jgi:hypothetical protein
MPPTMAPFMHPLADAEEGLNPATVIATRRLAGTSIALIMHPLLIEFTGPAADAVVRDPS